MKTEQDIINAIEAVNIFGKHSGLILNKTKTEAMWIGCNKPNNHDIGDIIWPNKPIKDLGIYFGTNSNECSDLNWTAKLKECNLLIRNWIKRKMSI